MTTITFTTQSAGETRALGARLGALLAGGDVVALHGELGAGKTTLVQGIMAGLGGARQATSPTFTLMNEQRARDNLRALHVDLYRLGASSPVVLEAESLGLEEVMGAADCVVLIEWAERLAGWLPDDCLHVELAHGAGEETRMVTLWAHGGRGAMLAERLHGDHG